MIEAKKVEAYFEDKRASYSQTIILEYLDSLREWNFELFMGQTAYKLYFEHNNFLYLMDETKDELAEYLEEFGWKLMSLSIEHNSIQKNMSEVTIVVEVIK